MRITGGALRGRNLTAPEGLSTRPTTDRVREALFNILAHHDWDDAIGDPLEDAVVLDAFAGTGALGIEALSHGAAWACFFEKDRKALRALHDNLTALKIATGRFAVLPRDVTVPPRAHKACTLIFLDPPYRKGLIGTTLDALNTQGWIAPNALLVTETAKNEAPEMPSFLEQKLEKTYGDTMLGFWSQRR